MQVTWKDRKVRVTLMDREVENPIARFFIGLVAIIGGIFGVLLAIVLFIALLPIWIPGHFLLRACGRKGFYTTERGFEFTLISAEAFHKA